MPWTRLDPTSVADALRIDHRLDNAADEAAAAQAAIASSLNQTVKLPR